ncbi:MAG: Wadjet anti-phage system protein JetA family protein [Pseudomonadota bacterium]
MAISRMRGSQLSLGDIPMAEALFEKLPDRLFGPLAAQNRRTYWRVICRLYSDFFGPDVSAPPIDGYPIRTIQSAVEDELSRIDDWLLEDGETMDTPLAIRANQLMKMLVGTGWLTLTSRGAREYVSMRSEILSFTGALISYAQAEPVFFSAKVRSIKSLLEAAHQGDGDGDQLNEAASQSRQLIEYIRHMIGAVSALEATFRETKTTAEFVRVLFTEFIETHFIGDYRELRTSEHPLADRNHIVEMAENLLSPDSNRERLLVWYQDKRANGNRDKAEVLFHRDIGRLLDFNRIDEFLLRLDDEVRRVNQRAVATLDYKLRSTQHLDQLLQWATRSVLTTPEALSATPFAPGEMVAPDRLYAPPRRASHHQATTLRDNIISDDELAKAALRLRAREARTLTAPELAGFVRNQMENADAKESADLSFTTIKDVRALQVLMALATTSSLKSPKLDLASRAMTRGFRVRPLDTAPLSTPFLTGTPFRLERVRPKKTTEEESNR